MSTHWDLCCTECHDHLGMEVNHGDHYMLEIIELAPKLAVVGAAILELKKAKAGNLISTELKVNDLYPFDVSWFGKHKGHKLRPINEYGRFYGQCTNRVTCPCCQSQRWCPLEEGHKGPCEMPGASK